MKKLQSYWLLSVQILLFLSTVKNTVLVNGQCINEQRSHLLHLKKSLTFDLELSTRLVQWNPEEDCCGWNGVGCDSSGRVITLELDHESISGGVNNLTSLFKLQFLEKLNLGFNDFVDIPIPTAVANLTYLVHLNLSNSGFVGKIPTELSNLRKLVSLDLSSNYIAAEVPEFFANMPDLRTLSLSSCNLMGQFPEKIFQVPGLQTLVISNNKLLQGSFPEFPRNSSLRTIELSSTSFSGSLPNSIGNLDKLSRIELSFCNFSGIIPAALPNLLQLSFMDLSYNNFSGTFPQFQASKNLVHLDLSHNSLTGSFYSAHFKGLQSLETLNLGNNFISRSLPSSIFKLPSLRRLQLSYNQFSGQIDEIPGGLSVYPTQLVYLDLSSNRFNGFLPNFLFELKELKVLALSSNSFTDTIHLETFKNLPNLTRLELSNNNFTVEPQSYNSSIAELSVLKLASCKLKSFPQMKGQAWLSYLDLSDNEIIGEIPNWIWKLGLRHVNLSLNFFEGLEKSYETTRYLDVLDLHSNQLQGEVPIRLAISRYADYSGNKFNGTIPSLIILYLFSSSFLSISNNSLTGSIPDSICNATNLLVLDLSFNAFNGTIPSCLMTSGTLGVLNLGRNHLSGSIPDTFSANCSLKSLDLGMNLLQGKIPSTLSNCALLEVLNLGYNKIEDSFPCMFENSFSLQVLFLRSNKFHGELECFGYNYSWPQLQMIDIASNNFSGVLSPGFFSSFKNMLSILEPGSVDHLRFNFLDHMYYPFKVIVNMKGHEMGLGNMLILFTTIDFSNNKFSGKIPESVGDVKVLNILNLSHNEITGGIPSSIGKLQNLGSLDLSKNQLTGEIPSALEDLSFLSFLNLSFNILTGEIPVGHQFQTFPSVCYMGNVGLCGFPLDVSCDNASVNGSSSIPPSSIPSLRNMNETDWIFYITTSGGYTVGLWICFMLLLFCGRWRLKLFHQVDQLLLEVLGKRRIDPKYREPIRRL